MSKNSLTKYFQKKKRKTQKKHVKGMQVFLKKKNEKRYDCERYKNLPEDQKKSLLSIAKNITK